MRTITALIVIAIFFHNGAARLVTREVNRGMQQTVHSDFAQVTADIFCNAINIFIKVVDDSSKERR